VYRLDVNCCFLLFGRLVCVNSLSVFLLLLCSGFDLFSQTDLWVVDSVQVAGNDHTANLVILREIDLKPGDSLIQRQLDHVINQSRARLESTFLFAHCQIRQVTDSTRQNHCWIQVHVTENWFLYPYLIFELADRNPNVWIREQDVSLSRANIGLGITHLNLTGRKDRLKLRWHTGYTRKTELVYELPYLLGRFGLTAQFAFAEQKELAYRTYLNKLLFYRADPEDVVFSLRQFSVTLHYRPSATLFHAVKFDHQAIRVHDDIAQSVNRQFLGGGRSIMTVPSVEYMLRWDKTVYPNYPVAGYRMELRLKKEGFSGGADLNTLSTVGQAELYTRLWSNVFLAQKVKFRKHLGSQSLPYYFQQGIGYKEDKLTGYDLYVLDGRDFLLLNQALKWQLTDRDLPISGRLPAAFRKVNLKTFFRFSFDVAYAHDPVFGSQNPYSNSWQVGYGPGLDVLIQHSLSCSLTYGITRFGIHHWYLDVGFIF